MSAYWVIVGATSPVARAFSLQLAKKGASFLLLARDHGEFEPLRIALMKEGAAGVACVEFDASAPDWQWTEKLDGSVFNVAVFLGAQVRQAAVDIEPDKIGALLTVNAEVPMTLLHRLREGMIQNGKGCIVGVGSVSGDRGRAKNYAYAASKAAFHTYLSGLRSDLSLKGLQVVTVKLGYVARPDRPDDRPGWLVIEPERAARGILHAIETRRNVVYVPGYWRWIMSVVRAIPEPLFKRTRF